SRYFTARAQSLPAIASFASPYRRCADQPTVSSSMVLPHATRRSATTTSKLKRMREKNYNRDWDAALAAPMTAAVPAELGGLRLDQALVRVFPQYSRNRLQAWLKSGHITIGGRRLAADAPVTGGETITLRPPAVPDAAAPQAQRMPLKVVFEDAALIVLDKPAGLVVHPGAGQPDRTLLNALLAHAPALAGVPRAGIVHRL